MISSTISMIFGIVLALFSVFFVFYTTRLLYVTHGLNVDSRRWSGRVPGCGRISLARDIVWLGRVETPAIEELSGQ